MLNAGTLPTFESDLVLGLVGAMSDIVLILDVDRKIVAAAPGETRRSMGDIGQFTGKDIESTLDQASRPKLKGRLDTMLERVSAGDKSTHVWCEVTHDLGNGTQLPVRYSIHWINNDSRFLLLGRDQRPIVELQRQLVSAQVALERDYEMQREMDSRYRMLMEVTVDPVMFISAHTNRIVDLNAAAAEILGGARGDLSGTSIEQEFDGYAASEFMERALEAGGSDGIVRIEVLARRSQKRVALNIRVFRAAGERLLLCRLEDTARSPAGGPDPLGDNLRALYAKGIDAVVFTDHEGTIISASESFLNLTDSATLAAVKGRSMSDFLTRGSIDAKVLLENAMRAGHLRLYPTRLKTDFDGEIAVEISATRIGEGPTPVMGLVIRDASRSEALRTPVAGAETNMVNVMDLVGSASLRDIVAETTNVVEKLCIETAVELTRNNRVAAAEMLGLSRQSLYVKLRKYGLLNRDED